MLQKAHCSQAHPQWEAAARLIEGDAAYLLINHSNSNYVPHRNIPIAKFLEAPFRFSCCKDTIWDCCLVFKLYLTLATPWTVAHQAPLFMGIPRQKYWSGLPFSSPADLFNPRDRTHVSCTGRQILYHWATWKPLFEISSTLTWAYYIITKEQLICICNNVNDLVLTVGWRHSVRNRIKQLLGETIRELTHTVKPCWKKRPKKCTYQVVHRKTLILPRYRLYLYKPKKKIPEVFFLRKKLNLTKSIHPKGPRAVTQHKVLQGQGSHPSASCRHSPHTTTGLYCPHFAGAEAEV